MAVGCLVALILDNTIPGTIEERGLKVWRQYLAEESDNQFETASIEVYDLPFCLKRLSNWKGTKYLPFLPYKDGDDAITTELEMDGSYRPKAENM